MSGKLSVNTGLMPSVSADRSMAISSPPLPAAPSGTTAGASKTAFPNPEITIDPALGIAVLEFRDASGAVVNSIPSQRQIDAYRLAQGAQTATNPQANFAAAQD